MCFHVEFHPPGMPGTGQKVCVVVVGGGSTVNLALALVQTFGLGFEFGLGPSWTIILNQWHSQQMWPLYGACQVFGELVQCSLRTIEIPRIGNHVGCSVCSTVSIRQLGQKELVRATSWFLKKRNFDLIWELQIIYTCENQDPIFGLKVGPNSDSWIIHV